MLLLFFQFIFVGGAMASYPIWNKIQACIYKAPKSYGVKSDGTNEILVGTSAKNSHSFINTRVTHRKNEDGTRTYHYYIDGKLYAKGVLIGGLALFITTIFL